MLNYNGDKWIKDCIGSLKEQTCRDFEAIVVDNASSDNSADFVRKNCPEIRLIANSDNKGYAAANNLAAKEAGGEYLFFINNDLKLDPKCIESLVNKADEDKTTVIHGCYFYSYDGKEDLYKGKWLGMDPVGCPLPSNKMFYADGAAFFVSREIFGLLGGFDNDHFMFAEDIDLCWRAWIAGFKVAGVKDAVVFHEGGGTAGGSIVRNAQHETSVFRRYCTERNTLVNLIKNYSLISLIFIIPVYIILYLLQILLFLCLLRFKVVWDVYLRSAAYVVVNLGNILRKRGKVGRLRRVSDLTVFMNITFSIAKIKLLFLIGVPKIKQSRTSGEKAG
ncbi:glycosyltransferase family 2 protein [Candidatus Auribacterota bacterium]